MAITYFTHIASLDKMATKSVLKICRWACLSGLPWRQICLFQIWRMIPMIELITWWENTNWNRGPSHQKEEYNCYEQWQVKYGNLNRVWGGQWLRWRVLDLRSKCSLIDNHQRHFVVSWSKRHYPLLSTGWPKIKQVLLLTWLKNCYRLGWIEYTSKS